MAPLKKCDSCGKMATCTRLNRNYQEDFSEICCKCLWIDGFFWRFGNNTRCVCEHEPASEDAESARTPHSSHQHLVHSSPPSAELGQESTTVQLDGENDTSMQDDTATVQPPPACARVGQHFLRSEYSHPQRNSCCLCETTVSEYISRNVSHPCNYWCTICKHKFDVPPISVPQVYMACSSCLHSCEVCCGENAPHIYSVDIACEVCLAETVVRLYPSKRGTAAWERVELDTSAGIRRWDEECPACGYRPTSEWSPDNSGSRHEVHKVEFDKKRDSWAVKLCQFTVTSMQSFEC